MSGKSSSTSGPCQRQTPGEAAGGSASRPRPAASSRATSNAATSSHPATRPPLCAQLRFLLLSTGIGIARLSHARSRLTSCCYPRKSTPGKRRSYVTLRRGGVGRGARRRCWVRGRWGRRGGAWGRGGRPCGLRGWWRRVVRAGRWRPGGGKPGGIHPGLALQSPRLALRGTRRLCQT